jgi:PAS domain S-box-containing protein
MSRFFSLRVKLVILTCSLLIGFGLAVGVYLKALFADHLSQELLKRGISIAHHLSTLSANAFIEGDTLYLDYLAKDHQHTEDDIVYIFMLSPDGKVLAHSFDNSYPVELITVNPLPSGTSSRVVRVDMAEEALVYDIAVPVLDGRPGSVHLGISAVTVSNAVQSLILQILTVIGVTGLIALGIALIASRQISRPIALLTQAVEALAAGNKAQHLPVEAQDEVGQLTIAFNRMVEQLAVAENRLNYQKRFLEILLDDIPTPVFYKDHQGRMLGCNRAYCDFWGHNKATVLGRKALDIYSSAEAGIHAARDAEVFGRQQAVRYELAVRDADDMTRQMVFHKAPFFDQETDQAGLIGVMLDITKEHQAEQLRGEFVSTVAHEFQTPLATIIGFAELLLQVSLEEATAQDALDTIVTKAEALSGMVDELLDLTRIEAGRTIRVEMEYGDLRPTLAETLENFRASCSSHEMVATLPDGPINILVDRDRLVQVVDNLLSNAVKYSAPGSQVAFKVEDGEQDLRFTIADEGIGMSADQSTHLFEKFYRADTSNTAPPGTGLGLYICKAIIDAHAGDIQITSSPGQGTQVVVRLPKNPPQVNSGSAATPAGESPGT